METLGQNTEILGQNVETLMKIFLALPFVAFALSFLIRHVVFGFLVGLFELALSTYFVLHLVSHGPFSFSIPIAPEIGLTLTCLFDGLNALLIWLTSFLFTLVFLYAIVEKKEFKDVYHSLFLLLFALLNPAFLTTNLLAFYFFFDATLIPMFLIIGIWGTGRKIYSAFKFLLFTFAGSILFLVSVVVLGVETLRQTGKLSFELSDVVSVAGEIGGLKKVLLFLGFFLAFAVKIPLVPLHVWLPDAHTEAPTGGSVILAGILLKLGSYAFLRFAVPVFPDVIREWWYIIGIVAVVGVVAGGFLALAQVDIKRLIAYSSVSHMGYVMLGSVALAEGRFVELALEGAILQMINHGIATGALFFCVGMIYERAHTRMIDDFSGVAKVMPRLAVLFMIFTLSSIGFPSTGGFIGELFVVLGAIKANIWLAVATAFGAVLSAGYMLRLVLKVFFGEKAKTEAVKHLYDIGALELITLLCLAVFVFAIGLAPSPFLKVISTGVDFIQNAITGNHTALF